MASCEKELIFPQGPPKRKRDVVQIPAVIETPLVPAENAPSSSGWHSNVVLLLNLMMSFLCIVFSLLFFYFVWVCVDNFL
jgi:hypothetical protein